MITASVIICAYTLDRWDDLVAAVASVRMQNIPACEILVVIDYNDELLQRARSSIPGVRVIPNMNGSGLSGGRMTGAALARGEVIVFLDDDAAACDADWLGNLLEPYTDRRVLGVMGHIEPTWRSPPARWFPPEFNWVVGCTFVGMPVHRGREVRNMIGANMSVRAEVLRRTGGFASKLGRREGGGAILGLVAESCEETEFCIRASQLYPEGIWIYANNARVSHSVPASRTTWRYFVRRCRMEGVAKAVLTGLTGPRKGLASERQYAITLLSATMKNIVTGQFSRGAAISIGFTITAFAYAGTRIIGLYYLFARREVQPQLESPPEILPLGD